MLSRNQPFETDFSVQVYWNRTSARLFSSKFASYFQNSFLRTPLQGCFCYYLFVVESLRKKCPYSELFWPAFSRIRTENGKILRISPNLVQMRENAGKMRTRITPTRDLFYAVNSKQIFWHFGKIQCRLSENLFIAFSVNSFHSSN